MGKYIHRDYISVSAMSEKYQRMVGLCKRDELSKVQTICTSLMEVLGNIYLPDYILDTMLWHFRVTFDENKLNKENILGIYSIAKRYPMFDADILFKIFKLYDPEFFRDKYFTMLDEILNTAKDEKEMDKMFDKFFSLVEKEKNVHDRYNALEYVDEAKKLDTLKGYYNINFISFLKQLIISKHYSYDYIVNNIPAPLIVLEDEVNYYRLNSANEEKCMPLSYLVTEVYLETGNLDLFEEQLFYNIDGTEIPTIFTISDFKKSIKVKKFNI